MEESIVVRNMFGGEIAMQIFDAPQIIAKNVLEEAYTEGLRLQKIFNFYDNNSTLSELNQRRILTVPPEFLEVLKTALKMCKKTKGRYDITLGKQFLQRKKGIATTPLMCSYKDVVISGNTVELRHPDLLIDLGSIAKGYIADKIVAYLESCGVLSGIIDARGDIRFFGNGKKIIEIQHPREKNKSILKIGVTNQGVATSGDYYQYDSTFAQSHILHQENYSSVTVVAKTLMEADVWATAAFVTPQKEIATLLKRNKHIKVCCIDTSLNTAFYNNFEDIIGA